MDVIIKILLSTTLIYAINFVIKTFTANNFDKMFMPKYQKTLHNIFLVVSIFFVFIFYGIFFAAMYRKIHEIDGINIFVIVLVVLYILGLLLTGFAYLYKLVCDKIRSKKFVFSVKHANILLFIVFILNILVYSITLHEMYYIDISSDKAYWVGNLLNCIFLFFVISYLLLKVNLYLQGINKREWDYVLSPTPENIEQKHLYVLYSLNPNTLVLSDDPNNRNYPKSVYLFDLNKNSYTYFNRVVNLKYK